MQQDSGWCCCMGVVVMVDNGTRSCTAKRWLDGCGCDDG